MPLELRDSAAGSRSAEASPAPLSPEASGSGAPAPGSSVPPLAHRGSPQIPNFTSPRALARDASTGAHVFVLPDGRELGYRVFHVHGRKHRAAGEGGAGEGDEKSKGEDEEGRKGGEGASDGGAARSGEGAARSGEGVVNGSGHCGGGVGASVASPSPPVRSQSPPLPSGRSPSPSLPSGASRSASAAPAALDASRSASTAPPPDASWSASSASYDDVIVYLHGFWSSSGEARPMGSIVLSRELGATVVAVDRPGYGRSSPSEALGPDAFAMDVLLLLGHLRVGRAFVMGTSGGSPYAVTLVARLGPRARGLALLVPLFPTPRLKGSGGPGGVLHWPSVVRARLRAGQALTALLPQNLLLRAAGFPEADLAIVRNEDAGRALRVNAAEGQAHSGVEGPLRDLWTFTQDGAATLPFDAIACRATIWAGEDDTLTPPDMARAYAKLLPKATLHVVPNKGHLSLPFTVGAGLLDELLAFDANDPKAD